MKKNLLFFASILTASMAITGCSLISFITDGSSSSYHHTSISAEEGEKGTVKYTYADIDKYNVYNCEYCPTVGNPKLLVIPIWFTDSNHYINSLKKDTVREDINIAFNGSEAETGWHSVTSYYQKESQGLCNLTATVSDWYECGVASSTFYSSMDKTINLVNEAADWYFSNNGSDKRTNYDSDNDGYLDGVILIYGSPDYAVLNNSSASNMWAYCYWTYKSQYQNKNNPGGYTFLWASYDFMYSSGRRAMTQTGYTYGHGDTSNCTIDAHTYIHEMGHVFGLDDYYDYSSNQYKPAGGFSMQDFNIGGHDPFSVMAFGWAEPIVPTESCTLQIKRYQDNRDFILLSPDFTGSPFDEYLLLELYSPTGLNAFDCNYSYGSFPKGPGNVGIRLWHVDARLSYYFLQSGEYIISPDVLTTVPQNYCFIAYSNTYEGGDHASSFGEYNSKYYNYNLLQLIRNDTTASHKNKEAITNNDLFYEGDSFSMSKFSKQFVEVDTLNNGESLGWSFTVDSIYDGTATISFTKA